MNNKNSISSNLPAADISILFNTMKSFSPSILLGFLFIH